jgi:ribosomal protein S18 acetylase RimI-like enzyme
MGVVRVKLRSTTDADLILVKKTLYTALSWDPDDPIPPFETVVDHPNIRIYHDGWMRPGDDGLAAETQSGLFVGMAYCRQFLESEGAQGFFDADTPELAVAVHPRFRGRGVGRRLIRGLHQARRRAGTKHISLSVDAGNPAVRLYQDLGYREVRRDGDGIVMCADLRPRP